jgi:hypothetical protein
MSADFVPPNGPSGAGDESPAKGKRRFENRRLDPWERYRVLTDMVKLHQDILEMADRRTRFGLLILGTLNALNVVLVARPDLLVPAGIPARAIPGVAVYVGSYATISVFLFVQAVIALKPRATPLLTKQHGPDRRLRHFGAIASQTHDEYLDSWRQATIANVNKELTFHVQLGARVAVGKYVAIERLFWGLMLLVFLTAGMLLMVMLQAVLGSHTG